SNDAFARGPSEFSVYATSPALATHRGQPGVSVAFLHGSTSGRSAMAAPQFKQPVDAEDASRFSPVDDEPPLHWERVLRLAPKHGLGVARRAIFFALVTWVPIAIWSVVRGRFIDAAIGEPLLQHYGVHVRCLVAIPLMILGEATLHHTALRYLPQ